MQHFQTEQRQTNEEYDHEFTTKNEVYPIKNKKIWTEKLRTKKFRTNFHVISDKILRHFGQT